MTPISATGPRRRETGFTLVEVMVVVTLIGLVAGLAMLSVPDPRPSVTLEAERFGARLQRAQEEAILTNRAVEVALTPSGYAFRVRDAGGWRPLTDAPFGEVVWEPDTAVRREQRAGAVAFDPAGGSSAGAFSLSRDGRSVRVEVDPAGNVRIDAARKG